ARHDALAVDHAALVEAFVRLAEATGRRVWIDRGVEIAEILVTSFHDPVNGGFFTVANDGEQLVVRQKDLLDNATPGANSLAAMGLLRQAALTGRQDLHETAIGTLRLLVRIAAQAPSAAGLTLLTLDLAQSGTTEVAIVGNRPDLVESVWSKWRPTAVLAWGEPYGGPLWEARRNGLAYVCRNHTCSEPTADAARFRELLG
ncbi:MAG: hypothetical protein ACKODY_02410, partial [Actinomycetota bacterium]